MVLFLISILHNCKPQKLSKYIVQKEFEFVEIIKQVKKNEDIFLVGDFNIDLWKMR